MKSKKIIGWRVKWIDRDNIPQSQLFISKEAARSEALKWLHHPDVKSVTVSEAYKTSI